MTLRPDRRRYSRREVARVAVVCGSVVGLVVLTYVVVVVGGGLLLGDTSMPHVGLSVLATAVVALAFDPMVGRLQRFARRVVGAGPEPYDALRRFAGVLADSRPTEDLTLRMARLLAEGTGAAWAQVRVNTGDSAVPAATWPPDAEEEAEEGEQAQQAQQAGTTPGVRRLPVRHGHALLGELVLREQHGVPLTPVELRLFAGLASQAGLVLRGAQLRATLEQRLRELSSRETELRESRERLVDAQDAARWRLERDIHDGAQQHLVALAVNLRLAATFAVSAPERVPPLLEAQERAAADAVAALLQLSRGIYPPLLEDAGVAAALRAVSTAVPVEVREHGTMRHAADVEAAAYFCCLEAVQNAAKHAAASRVAVDVDARPDGLTLVVEDDGCGFAAGQVTTGSGMTNMRDRVDSFGGTLSVVSAPGRGTRVKAWIPDRVPAAAQGGA